ncbi:hypothetical protein HPO_06177 [Hyphomonas polymorpha PS728]|uniref:DUF2127 domain-containing protein n=1 Tax=Hyphomonas polymorpha PS728 TaxID=1280954 RepID=A0A062VLK5_9PROT|nr:MULTISPECIES: hypothetical protein [Hyphomonas]AXE63896.1 hypothetical protein BBF93_06460 [Hyphomonas sp. CACIAM 19H1]KCZ99501.1 hypothetical protein HPO_06177 [Hyphomonas polymorpha PS728]
MDRDLDFEEATALIPAVQKHVPKAPWHLPVIGAIAVLWSLLGVFDLLAMITRFAPYMNQMPELTREFIYELPPAVIILRAVAVFATLAGAVYLIRKRLTAVRILALGATATILGIGFTFANGAPDDGTIHAVSMFTIVVSVLLLYYAQTWAKFGVLK